MSIDRSPTSPAPLAAYPLLRALLLGTGVLSTALGVLGIFLPLLPTVPLLLLAAAVDLTGGRCHVVESSSLTI